MNSFEIEPWIGVDLDGTLAQWHDWMHVLEIGEPVHRMVEQVKMALALGHTVKIFTARVDKYGQMQAPLEQIVEAIQNYTEKHIGVRLEVTNQKDSGMVELWDDRAVTIERNTGIFLVQSEKVIIV